MIKVVVAVSIGAEDDPYLCIAVVRVPAGPQTLLTSNIPDQEVCVSDSDLLNVAANGWGCVNGFLRQAVLCGRGRRFK